MGGVNFRDGQRVRLLQSGSLGTVAGVVPNPDGSVRVFVQPDAGEMRPFFVAADGAGDIAALESDGGGDSSAVLAGMWTGWMAAANANARTTMLASSTLRPYAHQANAVYGAMLPQPWLRFLLGDEPGTGKTIMAGMYLRETQRLGLVRRALVVAPANLVTKWQEDFDRFFGGDLRRITATTVREHALDVDHDMWIVSLELAAMNPNIQDAISPSKAGWDVVVFDEAHRLTPTAVTRHRVGRMLAKGTPRALLMTATPHRGSEWLFRSLLHLVDPAVYPDAGYDRPKDESDLPRLRPSAIHFLRRMKEDLVHYDGKTPLFKGRTAENVQVPLNALETGIYQTALDMVDRYFPPSAQPLARMVYGKRAASTLHALRETLNRRVESMGKPPTEQTADVDPFDDEATPDQDEQQVVHVESVAAQQEKRELKELIRQIDGILASGYQPSKWKHLTTHCLAGNEIEPGSGEQSVVFTEYADSAEWIVKRLIDDGYTARMYSGRQPNSERDEVRAAFMRKEFQIIVSTDAGNEGIDLQSAHVLANYDIPWSLVTLEQRMGRIHRVGQNRDVLLYNLIATGTREGNTLSVLLDRFVTAANELDGKLFDSLSLVAELTGVHYEQWLAALYGNDQDARNRALEAANKVSAVQLKRVNEQLRVQESELSSAVEARAALTLLQDDLLERVNPAIVNEYLKRLNDAHLLTVSPAPQGQGILRINRAEGLPKSLDPHAGTAFVAVSGDVLRAAAEQVDVTGIVPLGPGEPGFTDLLNLATTTFQTDMYRGAAADDTTSVTGYDLYAFTAEFRENEGRKTTRWATLIRVDGNGDARPVRWETLANLTPSTTPAGPQDPDRLATAIATAQAIATESEHEQQAVRDQWTDKARNDLKLLPMQLTKNLPPQQRPAQFNRLKEQTADRLTELEALSKVSVTEPVLVGHLRVHPAGKPPTAEETNSEAIAMARVAQLLTAQGWTVDDVHTENRGYDLLARRGPEQRQVEVKGIWGSATSTGIRMTGNEVLIAAQHRDTYWLYVVDQCSNGTGNLVGAFPDPLQMLGADMAGDMYFRIQGSTLKRHAATDEDGTS